MIWVAIENTDTHEVTDFVRATEKQVLDLMDVHRADKHDVTEFRVGRHHVVYEGVTYKGGYGYNILVASKCGEVYSGLYCGHY